MHKYSNSFARNLTSFSILTWVSFIISFVSAPISTRIYIPNVLGRINLFNTYSTMVMSLAYLGLDQAYVRFYNEPPLGKSKETLFSFCVYTSILSIFITTPIFLIFYRKFSVAIVGTESISIVVLLIISSLTGVLIRYLNLQYRMKLDAKWYTIQGILDILCVKFSFIITGFFIPSYQIAIFAMTASRFIFGIIFFILQRNQFVFKDKLYERLFAKEIAKFALPLVPITFLSWANSSISQIVLKNMLGFGELGIYSMAVGLASTVNIIQAGFNVYWAPYVYGNYKNKNNNFWQIHKLMVSLLTLAALAIIALQDPHTMLLGEKYRPAKSFFPFLLFSPICYTIAETTGLGINISKKTYWNIIIFSLNIIISIIGCYSLIPFFGVSGAAMASAIAAIVYLAVRTVIGEKYYRSIQNYKYMSYGIFLLILAALVNYYAFHNNALKYSSIMIIILFSIILFRNEIQYLFSVIKREVNS